MYTPIGILIAQALASIALAASGGLLFWSITSLIKTKQKLLPLLYFGVFADVIIFLLMAHVYCGFLR